MTRICESRPGRRWKGTAVLILSFKNSPMSKAMETNRSENVLAVSVLLIVFSVLATLIPARRAAKVEPTVALRHK